MNAHKDYAATRMLILLTLAAAMFCLPDYAYATNTPMGKVLCTVVLWFTGNTGKGLATICVTIIGIGALQGKVSWGMAILVGIGIAIVFGATKLVSAMGAGGGSTAACSTT